MERSTASTPTSPSSKVPSPPPNRKTTFISKLSMKHNTTSTKIPVIYPPALMSKFQPKPWGKDYQPERKSKLGVFTSHDIKELMPEKRKRPPVTRRDSTYDNAAEVVGVALPYTEDEPEDEPENEPEDEQEDDDASIYSRRESESDANNAFAMADGVAKEIERAAKLRETLSTPFDINKVKPLTHITNSWLLSEPSNAETWCIAVIHQRWYQALGYKWLVPPRDFLQYAWQGEDYLEKLRSLGCERCVLQPSKYILHRWALEILFEVQEEIDNPTERAQSHFRDGAWAFPLVITPDIVEFLPLPYEEREYYHTLIGRKWYYLERPHYYIDQSRKQMQLAVRNHFLSQMAADIGTISLKIGLRMKEYLLETNTPFKLKRAMVEWQEEVERERRAVEDDMHAESERRMGIYEREQADEITQIDTEEEVIEASDDEAATKLPKDYENDMVLDHAVLSCSDGSDSSDDE